MWYQGPVLYRCIQASKPYRWTLSLYFGVSDIDYRGVKFQGKCALLTVNRAADGDEPHEHVCSSACSCSCWLHFIFSSELLLLTRNDDLFPFYTHDPKHAHTNTSKNTLHLLGSTKWVKDSVSYFCLLSWTDTKH